MTEQNPVSRPATEPGAPLGPGSYAAKNGIVYHRDTTIAQARSQTMALRIANALNQYKAGPRGH